MSAAELIEQIKALPAAEREIVRNFLLNGDEESDASAKYLGREDARALGSRIMEGQSELFRRLAE